MELTCQSIHTLYMCIPRFNLSLFRVSFESIETNLIILDLESQTPKPSIIMLYILDIFSHISASLWYFDSKCVYLIFLQHIYWTSHPSFSLFHTAPNNGGVIAAAVISVLLILIIIAVILFCCYRSRHRKKYEKEICNEIRCSWNL